MKILTTILTYSGTQEQANACLDTWVNNIKAPHEYFFYGDQQQSQKMDKTWNCSPDEGEARFRLPEKTYKMLVESLKHEWDFLFKCDDDTYINFDKLMQFLKDYDASADWYIGGKIVNPFPYAQGGAGYILTRKAVEKCLQSLKHFYKNEFKNKSAEDYSIGLALRDQKIDLTVTDLLSTPSPDSARSDQSVCMNAIMNHDKITTHYVNSNTMRQIHEARSKR